MERYGGYDGYGAGEGYGGYSRDSYGGYSGGGSLYSGGYCGYDIVEETYSKHGERGTRKGTRKGG